jgi:WD40-like Beta Propeller Repeat
MLLVAITGLIWCGAAAAEPGPIRLVSQTPAEQAQQAIAPALSADGRYLAFQGEIGGQHGVFREDLSSGAMALVATVLGVNANPSISADGRYVSFTTNVALDPQNDKNFLSDVYVADMSASPPSYELASALDNCDPADPEQVPCGLSYEDSSSSEGSVAAGRVALSADGRKVAFATVARSDLGGVAGETPAGQVVLRDLATHRTTLVSVERDAETGAVTDRPVAGGTQINAVQLVRFRGAALSADGTTVAWMGAHLPAQVPLLADERAAISELDVLGQTPYVEPLWRRVADGPEAPIRRIVGGGDPMAPGCPPGGSLQEALCGGPFPALTKAKPGLDGATAGWLAVKGVDAVPQLSANGRTVALIGTPVGAANVFVVDMHDGLSRRQAVRELTHEVTVNASDPTSGVNELTTIPLNGHIFDLAISPGGNRIAFATARQRFPLSPPNLIGQPPAQLGFVELYRIDLDGETLQRITHGDAGVDEASLAANLSPAAVREGAGATSPSFDASGHLIAFASDASNLVPGDGNDASDAFVVEDGEASRASAASAISPGPRRRRLKRPKGMTLSAFSLPSGAVRLQAIVPSAGHLRARARGSLEGGSAPRSLALVSQSARKPSGGPVRLMLSLPAHLRRLAHTQEGLYATARVSFRRRHGKVLHGEIQVRFHAHRKHGGRR